MLRTESSFLMSEESEGGPVLSQSETATTTGPQENGLRSGGGEDAQPAIYVRSEGGTSEGTWCEAHEIGLGSGPRCFFYKKRGLAFVRRSLYRGRNPDPCWKKTHERPPDRAS
jgi:hypothetical protein